MNIVHAHVNIEEDAPASEQATSDYHRLLREAPDLAAIVVFHPVRQRRQLVQPPFHLITTLPNQKGISGRITL